MNFEDIVKKRRAVNFFDTGADVPDETLDRMIEMAANSPSSFNLQPWNLIAVRDPEEKAVLRKAAWDQPKVTEAPVVLILLADRDAWQAGHPHMGKRFSGLVEAGAMTPDKRDWFLSATKSLYGADPERALAFAAKNTGFFAMSLMYAAVELGFDAHPMDGFDMDAVREAFAIPENFWIPLLLAVGRFRPGVEPAPPKPRKTTDEIRVRFK